MSCRRDSCVDELLSDDSLSCTTCGKTFHFGCVGFHEAKFRLMKKDARDSWLCPECRCTGSNAPSALVGDSKSKDEAGISREFLIQMFSGLKDEMKKDRESASGRSDEILEKINVLSGKIDVCLTNYESLSASVDEMRNDLEQLKNDNLTQRVLTIERSLENFQGPRPCADITAGLDVECAVAEMEDRLRRARNLMIFSYPESSAPNPILSLQDDLSRVKASLAELSPEFAELNVRVARLGSFAANKIRPLKLVFDDSTSVTKILIANRAFDPPKLNASADRTPAQRKYLAELRVKLKERVEKGESDLTIKYISGIPTIVSKTNTSQSKNGN
uniref:Death-inducer obliterator 1 n=1 Tax=Lygus hesperus TaxID=30085 RepID=A0A0A9XFX0_LYGHE